LRHGIWAQTFLVLLEDQFQFLQLNLQDLDMLNVFVSLLLQLIDLSG